MIGKTVKDSSGKSWSVSGVTTYGPEVGPDGFLSPLGREKYYFMSEVGTSKATARLPVEVVEQMEVIS